MRLRPKVLSTLLILSALLFGCDTDSKKGYPTRPIKYLVPWSAGGMTDISSRAMAAVLQKALGAPVNVLNRTGGSGVVGHLALSKAPADGYTLGAVTVEISMMHHMKLTRLTHEDYTPLSLLIHNPAGITVRSDAPWNTLEELLAEIRANPGEIQASGTGRGGIWDLARVGFLKAAGLKESDMPWVPSQGSAPALQELISEGVDVVTASLSEVDALRQAGQVKTLAVMADVRQPEFPDVPTLKELGIDWAIGGWVALCAPPNLAPEVKTRLDSAIRVATQDPDFVKALTEAGSTIRVIQGNDLNEFMAAEDRVNGTLMQEANLVP